MERNINRKQFTEIVDSLDIALISSVTCLEGDMGITHLSMIEELWEICLTLERSWSVEYKIRRAIELLRHRADENEKFLKNNPELPSRYLADARLFLKTVNPAE